MAFSSFNEFLAMGGYGFYVWLSFGSGLGLMLALVWHSRWSRQRLWSDVRREADRQQRIKRYKQQQEQEQ